MSVIIDMDMPEHCEGCHMLEGRHDDGFCHAAQRWLDDERHWLWYQYPEGDIDDSKPVNCPLRPAPEQKHGIWLSSVDEKIPARLNKNGDPEETCWCSVCGEWLVASDEYPVRGQYCPNCGARMEES